MSADDPVLCCTSSVDLHHDDITACTCVKGESCFIHSKRLTLVGNCCDACVWGKLGKVREEVSFFLKSLDGLWQP